MLFLKWPGRPKDVPHQDHWPYPRGYWNPNWEYNAFSWTDDDIAEAERKGWFGIEINDEDNFETRTMRGWVTGRDPEMKARWDLPHYASRGGY